jgi:hypothetical protein
MTKRSYEPGGDQKAISRVAKAHFGGSHKAMFEHHGWVLEPGQQYMHQAAPRIVATYGSVRAFESHFAAEGKK